MISFSQLARLQQGERVNATFKLQPEDFFVEEILEPELAGDGEHLYLFVEKVGLNTQDVVQTLQRYFSLPEVAIGFCGRKDKHAITRQWFSLHLKKKIPVKRKEFERLGFKVLKLNWHSRKLRVGEHQANCFRIRLRDCSLSSAELAASLALLAKQGAPNYFGSQRFGSNNQNYTNAQKWFRGELQPQRFQRGLYLSTLRAAIFNEQLHDVISTGAFPFQPDNPQCLMLAGKPNRSDSDSDLKAFVATIKLSERNQQLSDFLCTQGVIQQQRAMRILPQDFVWNEQADGVELAFKLAVGSYATSLLREVFQLQNSATASRIFSE